MKSKHSAFFVFDKNKMRLQRENFQLERLKSPINKTKRGQKQQTKKCHE